ncbi:hypothetical protein, variant [Blastomyces dermatitidis ER-3]|uniref:Uncharacterized protein n=1 Tax=Ajellomyces dermatitidis (strain ER-3 / ATCC MYA-2586) TaxID=559297 RepID=A0ABX2VT22_AJEDR|nr:uncharacterized protein BDCG_02540 [Blastomyces dermatitidis ER-3]XP_045280081.1 hypothetical protein, variant [Blastomyces dermatitidis ER-3]OAT00353.1 hypothetical protein BDCG_02540 [Blastomyces dermatitidis ER-3]OAT00354.1 hypothetical protein, variant [Blastomyces dermatitidis ER-3]
MNKLQHQPRAAISPTRSTKNVRSGIVSGYRQIYTNCISLIFFTFFFNTASSSPDAGIGETTRYEAVRIVCSLLGSGLAFESQQLLAEVVRQSRALQLNGRTFEGERLAEVLVAVDGDLVQALTAVQKVVTTNNWGKTGEIPAARLQILLSLRTDLKECRERNEGLGVGFGFGRGSMMLENILSTMSE